MPLEKSGMVPVPDPTKLTTDAVALAKAELKELFDVKLNAQRELMLEKFAGVKTEFSMRDTALAAALTAADARVQQQNSSNSLAIDKSGDGFTKQIDSLDEKIDDLKERLSEVSGRNWSAVGAYIFGAFGIAALVAAAVIHH